MQKITYGVNVTGISERVSTGICIVALDGFAELFHGLVHLPEPTPGISAYQKSSEIVRPGPFLSSLYQ